MKIEVTITIDPLTNRLHVLADQCDGGITIPSAVDADDENTVEALAIIALLGFARKITAYRPWFAEVVADPHVREFVELAFETYAEREQEVPDGLF